MTGRGEQLARSSVPLCPTEILETYPGWKTSLAWHLEPAAAVWRLEKGERRLFVKVRARHRPRRLADEADRTRWAHLYLPAPRVVAVGGDAEMEWMVTEGLPGQDGTKLIDTTDPLQLVQVLARGLRRFHQMAPVDTCPFDFRLDAAVAQVTRLAAAGQIEEAYVMHGGQQLSIDQAIAVLRRDRPHSEDLVVCHGDYTFPNALIGPDGEVTGYLDLGALGIADRWWDLAVGSWSTVWNLGPGWEEAFIQAYGLKMDAERIAYYRLLYNLS